jgi:hypothetical protein
MSTGRYSVTPAQAQCVGKVRPAYREFANRRFNVQDPDRLRFSYGGNVDPDNLKIKPGEIIISKKGSVEEGFSAWNAFYRGDYTHPEALQRDYRVVGTCLNDYEYGGNEGQDPLDVIGFQISGTETINNTGNSDLPPGTTFCWRPPMWDEGLPRSQQGTGTKQRPGTEYDPRASKNRVGTPYDKILTEIVPFDPSDYSFQVAGIYHTLMANRPASGGGIDDIDIAEFALGNRKNCSNLQEETIGEVVGTIIKHAVLSEFENPGQGVAILRRYGILDRRLNQAAKNAMAFLLGRNCVPGHNRENIDIMLGSVPANKLTPMTADATNVFRYYHDHVYDFAHGAIASATWNKLSTIEGITLSGAKPGQSVDVQRACKKVCP